MRQGSSVTPANSSSTQVLHPVLQAALDGLDVELEEELTRYRRQRYRQSRQIGQVSHPIQSFTPKKSSSGNVPHLLQLPKMEEPGSQGGAAITASADGLTAATASNLSEPLDWELEEPASEAVAGVSALKGRELPSSSPALNQDLLARVAAFKTSASVSSPHALAIASSPASSPSHQPHLEPEPEPSALMAIESDLVEQESPESDFSDTPDDYLESSEELLRSIAEETGNQRSPREVSLLDSLLTPLGIGSMLLLLLSSATLGYVIMHPSSLDVLTARERKEKDADLEAANAPKAPAATVPDSPNLAAEEFVDLNVNSLSTLPGASPSPAAALPNSPTAGAAAAPTNLGATTPNAGGPSIATAPAAVSSAPPAGSASTYVPADPPAPEPVYIPEAQPEPVSVAPLPPEEPALANPEVATAPAAEQPAPRGNYYYVITPYSGDPSLENAREAVPDAYVRNFEAGANVQLGAFNDEARAEELIQQLQDQGIPAELYQTEGQPAPGQ